MFDCQTEARVKSEEKQKSGKGLWGLILSHQTAVLQLTFGWMDESVRRKKRVAASAETQTWSRVTGGWAGKSDIRGSHVTFKGDKYLKTSLLQTPECREIQTNAEDEGFRF